MNKQEFYVLIQVAFIGIPLMYSKTASSFIQRDLPRSLERLVNRYWQLLHLNGCLFLTNPFLTTFP